jgi:hypothetical protein
VNYDTRNWQLLIDQLNANHESIHVTNRAQIIDDALNLAVAGLLDYRLALAVTSYMHKEKEYIAWDAALSGLTHIDIMLSRTAAYGEFKVCSWYPSSDNWEKNTICCSATCLAWCCLCTTVLATRTAWATST